MKKILIMVLFSLLCISGCNCNNNSNDDQIIEIPLKQEVNDTSARTSPVNSTNLDYYMFRDDVQYVDLRSLEMIASEGYIAGFEFIPFYSIIASFSGENTLYRMKGVEIDGVSIPAGQPGSFIPQYEESNNIIKSLFSKDKYIFLVSQGGSECSYVINLLIQLGYNGNLIYNVGGVMNSEGFASYSSIETNKYFVYGHGNLNLSVKYDFMNELTPTSNN